SAPDNRVYQRDCFRCTECSNSLPINFSSLKGVLYCKRHFDQLFKRTGSLLDRSAPAEYQVCLLVPKRNVLPVKKTVYLIEKTMVLHTTNLVSSGLMIHERCVISPSNYVAHENKLYCKHLHSKPFRKKENFSQLDKLLYAQGDP
ncbi:LIM domain-containing protein, partial [Nymphaea thermarum]